MQKCRYINQTNFEIIFSEDMLRVRTFHARRESLHARNFPNPANELQLHK